VHHKDVRAWAMRCVEYAVSQSLSVTGAESTLKDCMSKMLKKKSTNNIDKCKFSFNSENGEAIGCFHYRLANSTVPASAENWDTYGDETYLSDEDINWAVENVGDMLKSNYIFI
jgi:hypothetical protein